MLNMNIIVEKIEINDFIVEYCKFHNINLIEAPTIWSFDVDFKYMPLASNNSFFFGSCNTLKKLQSRGFPNLFYNNKLDLPIKDGSDHRDILNYFYKETKIKDLPETFGTLEALWDNNSFFVKPASAMKQFTGQRVSFHLLDDFIDSLKVSNVDDNLDVIVSYPEEISQEWRLVLYNGKVIAASEYKRDGLLYQKSGAPRQAVELAEKYFNYFELPFVVIDVCLGYNIGYKIIEANCFNTS